MKEELRCKKCGLKNIYTKIDGTEVCRSCGMKELKEKKEGE